MNNVFSMNKKTKDLMGDMDWALTMTFDKQHVKNVLNTVTIDENNLMIEKIEQKLNFMADYSEAKEILSKFSLNNC